MLVYRALINSLLVSPTFHSSGTLSRLIRGLCRGFLLRRHPKECLFPSYRQLLLRIRSLRINLDPYSSLSNSECEYSPRFHQKFQLRLTHRCPSSRLLPRFMRRPLLSKFLFSKLLFSKLLFKQFLFSKPLSNKLHLNNLCSTSMVTTGIRKVRQ